MLVPPALVWIAAADGVEEEYKKQYEDTTLRVEEREAARLLASAKNYIKLEKEADAVQVAIEAHALFRKVSPKGNRHKGLADAARALAHGYWLMGRQGDADKFIRVELHACYNESDALGEAKMQLAAAEMLLETTTDTAKMRAARTHGEAALAGFQKKGDRTMEALASCVLITMWTKLPSASVGISTEEGLAMDANRVLEAAQQLRSLLVEDSNSKVAEATALHWLAVTHWWIGDQGAGMRNARKALAILRSSGDRVLVARELQHIGEMLSWSSPRMALKFTTEALELFRDVRVGKRREVFTLMTLFHAHLTGEDGQAAWDTLQTAQEVLMYGWAGGNKADVDTLMVVIQGHIDLADGNVPDEALVLAQEARDAVAQLTDKEYEARVLSWLAGLYFQSWQLEEAESTARYCLDSIDSMESVDLEVKEQAMNTVIAVHCERQDYDDALAAASALQALCKNGGKKEKYASCLLTMSRIYFIVRKLEEARRTAWGAHHAFQVVNLEEGQADALHMVSQVHMALEQHEEAHKWAKKCAQLFSTLGNMQSEVDVLNLKARNLSIMIGRDKPPETIFMYFDHSDAFFMALQAVTEALQLARALGDQESMAIALHTFVQVNMTNKRYKDALKAIEEALPILREVGDEQSEADLLMLKVDGYRKSGKVDESQEAAEQALEVYQRLEDAKGEKDALEVLSQLGRRKRLTQSRLAGDIAIDDVKPQASKVKKQEQQKEEVSPAQDHQMIRMVRAKIQEVTRQMVGATHNVEPDMPLMDLGITSMAATRYRVKVSDEFDGKRLPATLLFDYPTVNAITELLSGQHIDG